MFERRPFFLVVANPVARRNTELALTAIRHAAPAGAWVDVVETRRERLQPGELRERATGCAAVIAVGGDGTVAETVTGIDGASVPLGIVPAGSTNIIAQNLRIPSDATRAAGVVFARVATQRLDVGMCNGRRFLHMAGGGFDSRMFEQTDPRLKQRIGWLAYLQGASRTILAPPADFMIRVDGVEVECRSPLVLVANGAGIIRPSLPIHPGIRYDDGMLDVVIFTARSTAQIARTVARFASKSLERSPYTVRLRGRTIRVDSDPPIPIQLDGDVVDTTPADFTIAPSAIEIIVP
jgi:diacylglycerol kinase (ATP)